MPLWQWSTTPANNANGVTNIDWQYGMPPSDVSPSARQMMADIAAYFQGGPEWLFYGDVPTYINSTSFSVPGNQTARYTVGRRVRTTNTGGTFYGTIATSVYTSLTTVTVTMDGTGALDSGLSEVDLGILNPANLSVPENIALQLSGLTLNEPGNGVSTLTVSAPNDTAGANILLKGNGTTTPNKYLIAVGGTFQVANSARSAAILIIDDSGNLASTGNLTANSDERLKRDWKPLSSDLLTGIARVKSGTFTRRDTGARQVGVSAQDLQKVIPEAVDGAAILSVAYGQAAMVVCVELAKRVLRLEEMLALRAVAGPDK